MTAPGLEIVDLTSIVGDFEVSCDYADEDWNCQDDPASWVLHLKPCCPAGAGVRLACEVCKESRMMDAGAVECQFCGFVYEHAPEAYHYIEPLERK